MDHSQVKGLLFPEEINPFAKGTSERSTIQTQFCGSIGLLDNLKFTCKNNHNTHNPICFDAPAGIPNLKNSCYLSSALQCLLNFKALMEYILNIPNHIRQQVDFLNIFALFIVAYQKKKSADILLYTRLIKNALGKENDEFNGTKQCDMSECLEVILDILEREVQELRVKNLLTGPNLIHDLFTFKIGSKPRCTDCEAFQFLWEPSRTFPCEIEFGQDEEVSLLKCVRETILLFNKNCPKCLGNPIGMEQWETIPSVFMFQLNRVKFENKKETKIRRKVKIPKTFTIGLHTFALSSISSHLGVNTSTGHYVTDAR